MLRALASEPRWEASPRVAEIIFGVPAGDPAQPFGQRAEEKRGSHRRRVLLTALIVDQGFGNVVRCCVSDVSEHGARLKVPDGMILPSTFWLVAVSAGIAYQATTVWRRFPTAGVSVAEPIDLTEPAAGAGHQLRLLWLAAAK